MERKNIMINFIAMIICLFGAIFQFVQGDLTWFLVELAFTLLNLPFAIKWLKEYFE